MPAINSYSKSSATGKAIRAYSNPPISGKSSNYTLLSTDEGKIIRCTNSSDITITVPDVMSSDEQVIIRRAGTGKVTLAAGSGVTLNGVTLELTTQHTAFCLHKAGSGVFDVYGGGGSVSTEEPEEPGLTQLTAPTLDATGGDTIIDVSWNNVSNESSYSLQIDDNSGFSSPSTVSKAANSTSHQFTGLTNGTTYYIRIKAIGDGLTYSDSAYSATDTATPGALAPEEPDLTAGLVSHWKMNEDSSITREDETAGNLDLAVTGSIISTAQQDVQYAGKVGHAAYFDWSVAHYLSALNAGKFTGAFTISVLIKPEQLVTQGIAGRYLNGGSGTEYLLYATSAGKIKVFLKTTAGEVDFASEGNYVANTWYLITMQYTGSAVNIFINDTLSGSQPLTGTITVDNANEFRVGGYNTPNGNAFNGWMQHMRLYNRAISQAEIEALCTLYGV